MSRPNDLSRSFSPFDQQRTVVVVIEMSQSSWLVSGIVPGVDRQPLKKLDPDENALLRLLQRWRGEAEGRGASVERTVVAFEAGRDGFWLARWLRSRGIEAHVLHSSSVAVSREHRRAKTDRLDTELLKRAFLGWLRGEREHCKMVAIPTLGEEDAKRPSRERESLVAEQSRIINRVKSAFARLGIRRFNPKLKKAASRLDELRTPEGEPIPPNTLAAIRRDLERRQLLREQINRSKPLASSVWARQRGRGRARWCGCWHVSSASASRRRTCWCMRCCLGICAIGAQWPATPGSRAHLMRAAGVGARGASQDRATRGFAAA